MARLQNSTSRFHLLYWRIALLLGLTLKSFAAESPYLYGIHDHSPAPTEYLSHITNATGSGGWITATVAVGAGTNDFSGVDFSPLDIAGNTVICRINYGYFPQGTIPLPADYDNFAIRCRNFVTNSHGCSIWLIGNELNLSAEWPFDGAKFSYVSPQGYANCFRKVYDAIKAARPNDKVIPQATAPWGGPYGAGSQNVNGTNYPSDGQPLSWVQFENQVLSAITNSGAVDGIALHIGSRGYHYADIYSTNKFGSLNLYSSFFVYKDWVDYGIPQSLYFLPLYVTECNGLYYWKGGGPPGEDPSQHYEPGWMQEIYAEINRYNQSAITNGKPIFRCLNMYRWCDGCDGWNIDGVSDIYKSQILSDLDAAAAQHYAWPAYVPPANAPPAPLNVVASVGNGNITVTWDAAPFATTYTVKRSTNIAGPYPTIASNLVQTTFVNTSYTPNTTYYYRVSALNSFGESPDSQPVSATPTNGLPDVIVTAISWTPAGRLFGNTNVTFRATVLNQGSAPTPSGVTLGVGFLVDGSQVSWSGGFSSSLNTNVSITLTADGGPAGIANWTATAGPHTITANVDDIDRFPEGNENNNVLETNLNVYARGYAVNSGGAATGSFIADAYWTGSANTFSVTNPIDLTIASNPAPAGVYQSERWGNSTYTFSNLIPSTNYTIRLHFAEISPSVAVIGDRRFNVFVNGLNLLTNFDILANVGAKFRAYSRQFTAFPSASGQISVQLTQGLSNEAKINGIEILATPALPPPQIQISLSTNSSISLAWNAYPGKTYRVQYKEDLNQTNWMALSPDLTASNNVATVTGLPQSVQRYYRVVALY